MVFIPYDSTKRTRTLESDELCRLCLCGNDRLVNVFDKKSALDEFVVGMVKDLLMFEVVNIEGVPWFICMYCLKTLNAFRVFKSRCVENKKTWEDRFERRLAPQERNITEWPDLRNVAEEPTVAEEDDEEGDLMELGDLLLAENFADGDEIVFEITDDDNIYLTFPSRRPEVTSGKGNESHSSNAESTNDTNDISIECGSNKECFADGGNYVEMSRDSGKMQSKEILASEDADRRNSTESQFTNKTNNVVNHRGIEIGFNELNATDPSKGVSGMDKDSLETYNQSSRVLGNGYESVISSVDGKTTVAHQNTQLSVLDGELLTPKIVHDLIADCPEVNDDSNLPCAGSEPNRNVSMDRGAVNKPSIIPETATNDGSSESAHETLEDEIDVEMLEEDRIPFPMISTSLAVNGPTERYSIHKSKCVTTWDHDYTFGDHQQTTTSVYDEVNPSSSQPNHDLDGFSFRVSESEFHEIANNVFLGCDDNVMDVNLPSTKELVKHKSVSNGPTKPSWSVQRKLSRNMISLLKTPLTERPAECSSVTESYQDNSAFPCDLGEISRSTEKENDAQCEERVLGGVSSESASELSNRTNNFEDGSVSMRDLKKIERLIHSDNTAQKNAERAKNQRPVKCRRCPPERESFNVTDPESDSGSTLSDTPYGRQLLNQTERQRRHKMYVRFMDLKQVIPSLSRYSKVSKVLILNEAYKLCKRLKEEEFKKSSTIKRLKMRSKELKQEVKLLSDATR